MLKTSVYDAKSYDGYVSFSKSDLGGYASYYYPENNFSSSKIYLEFVDNCPSISCDYAFFRLNLYLPLTFEAGSEIDLNINLGFNGGTLNNTLVVFADNNGSNCSNTSYGSVTNNRYIRCNDLVLTSDSYMIQLFFCLSNRTSTSIQASPVSVDISYNVPDPVVDELEDMNVTSGNIFDSLSSMLLKVAQLVVDVSNMPVAIKNNLSSLFDVLADLLDGGFTNLPSNMASALSGYFLDLPSRLKDALSSCFDAVTVSMDNVLAFLPDDMAEVLKPVFDDFGLDFVSMITWLSSIDDKIGTLANNFAAGLGLELPSDYWTNVHDHITDSFKSVFVPEDEVLTACYDDMNTLLESRFGFFYDISSLIASYVGSFDSYTESPYLEVPVYTVDLAGTDFSIGGWTVPLVPAGLEKYAESMKLCISIVCTFLFIGGVNSRYNAFFGVR